MGVIVYNFKAHLLIGFLVGLYFRSFEFIMLTMVGAMLPDVDHPLSVLGRHNPFVKSMSHRGMSHSILGCALLSSPFLMFGHGAAFPVFVGAVSHVMGDFVSSLMKGYFWHVRLW